MLTADTPQQSVRGRLLFPLLPLPPIAPSSRRQTRGPIHGLATEACKTCVCTSSPSKTTFTSFVVLGNRSLWLPGLGHQAWLTDGSRGVPNENAPRPKTKMGTKPTREWGRSSPAKMQPVHTVHRLRIAQAAKAKQSHPPRGIVVVDVFTYENVPISAICVLTSVLVQLGRTPSVVTL